MRDGSELLISAEYVSISNATVKANAIAVAIGNQFGDNKQWRVVDPLKERKKER